MRFRKFNEFLQEREQEVSENQGGLNRSALDYDKKLAQFNARFSDPKEGAEIVKAAGYPSIGAFVSDPDERKWSKLRIPGQQNYTR